MRVSGDLTINARHVARVVNAETLGDIRVFECVTGQSMALITAGAHCDVYVADGTARQYSLLPSKIGGYRFAVKLEKAGRGGSRFLYHAVDVGHELEIGSVRNHFRLDESAAHTVLVAGGIGITPLYAMIRRLEEIGTSWELHYCSRNGVRALFAEQLVSEYPERVRIYDGSAGARLNLRDAMQGPPHTAHLYCCGPGALIRDFQQVTSSRPPHTVHVEFFQAGVSSPLRGYSVKLRRSGKVLEIPPNSSLLGALLNEGIEIPNACKNGVCGACEVAVLAGTPDHRDAVLSPRERASNTCIMPCCSGSLSNLLEIDV
jgi:tetrachlorobenzoquinone reductase